MIWFKPMTTEHEWNWMVARTHIIGQSDTQGICAYRGSDLKAVCVLDTFTPVSCTTHLAIDDPLVLRHGFLEELAEHIFVTCGKKRVFGLVPSNNEKALKMNRNVGFQVVARIPDTIEDGVDTIVMRLDKNRCRFLMRDKSKEAA